MEVAETHAVVGDRIRRAYTPGRKAIGLLGRLRLPAGEGLLIENTSSIHMFFMLFAIDCAYLDADLRVTKIAASVPPFGASWSGWPLSAHVLELPAGRCGELQIEVGQSLTFNPSGL